MVSFDGKDNKAIEFKVSHPAPEFLRFILGGSDLNAYPGFNGQFTRPVLKIGPGSFLTSVD